MRMQYVFGLVAPSEPDSTHIRNMAITVMATHPVPSMVGCNEWSQRRSGTADEQHLMHSLHLANHWHVWPLLVGVWFVALMGMFVAADL